MKKYQKGEIATVFTVATLIVIGISSFISSHLLKNKQTTKTKAESVVRCREGFPNDGQCNRCGNDGRFADAPLNWWDTGCLDFCKSHPNDAACLWCDFQGQEHKVGPYSNGPNDLTGKNCATGGTILTPTPESGACSMMDANTRNIIPNSQRQICENLNKCDVRGGCNGSCCAKNEECPDNMTCTQSDGYCQTGLACEPGQVNPTSIPTPTSPQISTSIPTPSNSQAPTSIPVITSMPGCPGGSCLFGSGQPNDIGPMLCDDLSKIEDKVQNCNPVPKVDCGKFDSLKKCEAAEHADRGCYWTGDKCVSKIIQTPITAPTVSSTQDQLPTQVATVPAPTVSANHEIRVSGRIINDGEGGFKNLLANLVAEGFNNDISFKNKISEIKYNVNEQGYYESGTVFPEPEKVGSDRKCNVNVINMIKNEIVGRSNSFNCQLGNNYTGIDFHINYAPTVNFNLTINKRNVSIKNKPMYIDIYRYRNDQHSCFLNICSEWQSEKLLTTIELSEEQMSNFIINKTITLRQDLPTVKDNRSFAIFFHFNSDFGGYQMNSVPSKPVAESGGQVNITMQL